MTDRASPPVLDHGAIGNGRVLALVSPRGSVDWLCMPRFDSASVFARILDERTGGTFRVLSRGGELPGEMSYVPNTNVLTTRFASDGAAWEIIDFAPRLPEPFSVNVPIETVRVLRPLAGQPQLSVDFDPRPDYARAQVDLRETADAIEVLGGKTPLYLYTNVPVPYVLGRREFVLKDAIYFVLSHGRRAQVPSMASIAHELSLTIQGWRAWAKTCALPSFAPAQVLRSALCLKLHVYHDTGAIIAAATTSIPEAMRTERTWDYRYCWLRDAAFVVEALRRLSQVAEGEKFIEFLRDVVVAGPLQPIYGIGGERDLTEALLPHLAGFGGNGHVRIGNAAYTHKQNDLMGEMILCLETLLSDPRIVHEDPDGFLPLVERLVEEAVAAAPTPDTGIWEFRTVLRQHTFSRSMCWVAMHRGARLARLLGRNDLAQKWEQSAELERSLILARGYNAELEMFTQGLDGQNPDAANLLLPTLGIIDARDPRFIKTVEAYERLLVEKGFMLRYRNPDDFGETTSAFTICSFWWAEALALIGRLDEATAVFDRLLSHSNGLGLFSEDIEPNTGALLGNMPQAYTHVGLINAATTIGQLLEARDGNVRAWT